MANPNGSKPDKLIRDALRKAVLEENPATQKTYLRDIAEAIRGEAVKGEAWACNMVADRLDGKAHQTSEITVNNDSTAAKLTAAELNERIADALERIDSITKGINGAGESENRPADIHKLN